MANTLRVGDRVRMRDDVKNEHFRGRGKTGVVAPSLMPSDLIRVIWDDPALCLGRSGTYFYWRFDLIEAIPWQLMEPTA